MTVQFWLDGLRARLRKQQSRRLPAGQSQLHTRLSSVERLQTRTMLTSQVLLLGSELRILTDADEDITVQEDSANPGFVQVLIDGTNAPGLPAVSGSALTQLTIESGDADNVIDVSGVTAGVFPALTGLTIVSGNGDDSITGSDDFADSIEAGDGG